MRATAPQGPPSDPSGTTRRTGRVSLLGEVPPERPPSHAKGYGESRRARMVRLPEPSLAATGAGSRPSLPVNSSLARPTSAAAQSSFTAAVVASATTRRIRTRTLAGTRGRPGGGRRDLRHGLRLLDRSALPPCLFHPGRHSGGSTLITPDVAAADRARVPATHDRRPSDRYRAEDHQVARRRAIPAGRSRSHECVVRRLDEAELLADPQVARTASARWSPWST